MLWCPFLRRTRFYATTTRPGSGPNPAPHGQKIQEGLKAPPNEPFDSEWSGQRHQGTAPYGEVGIAQPDRCRRPLAARPARAGSEKSSRTRGAGALHALLNLGVRVAGRGSGTTAVPVRQVTHGGAEEAVEPGQDAPDSPFHDDLDQRVGEAATAVCVDEFPRIVVGGFVLRSRNDA